MNPLHIFSPLRPTLAAPVIWTTRRRNYSGVYPELDSGPPTVPNVCYSPGLLSLLRKDMQWVQ
jgi:hypothetical protein